VDHVITLEPQIHGPTNRDVHLVRGDDVLSGVLVLPPELARPNGDLHGVSGLVGEVEDRPDRGYREDREDQGRDDREGDLDLRVAVELLGFRARPRPETDHGVDEQELHDEEDRDRDREGGVPQLIRLAGDRTLLVIEVILGRIRSTSGTYQYD